MATIEEMIAALDKKQLNVIQVLMEDYNFKETVVISKSIKDKHCCTCVATIPKGIRHLGYKIKGKHYNQLNFCPDCLIEHAEEIKEMVKP